MEDNLTRLEKRRRPDTATLGAPSPGPSVRPATSSHSATPSPLGSTNPATMNLVAPTQGALSRPGIPSSSNTPPHPNTPSHPNIPSRLAATLLATANPEASTQGPLISSTTPHRLVPTRLGIPNLQAHSQGYTRSLATSPRPAPTRLALMNSGASTQGPSVSSTTPHLPVPTYSGITNLKAPSQGNSVNSVSPRQSALTHLATSDIRTPSQGPSARSARSPRPARDRAQPQLVNDVNQKSSSKANLPHQAKKEPVEAAATPASSKPAMPRPWTRTIRCPKTSQPPLASEARGQEASVISTGKRRANTVELEPNPKQSRPKPSASEAQGTSGGPSTAHPSNNRIMKMRFEFKVEVNRGLEWDAEHCSTIIANGFNEKQPPPLYSMSGGLADHLVAPDPHEWKICPYESDEDIGPHIRKSLQSEIFRRITITGLH